MDDLGVPLSNVSGCQMSLDIFTLAGVSLAVQAGNMTPLCDLKQQWKDVHFAEV